MSTKASREREQVLRAAWYLLETGQHDSADTARAIAIRAHRLAMLRANRTFDVDLSSIVARLENSQYIFAAGK